MIKPALLLKTVFKVRNIVLSEIKLITQLIHTCCVKVIILSNCKISITELTQYYIRKKSLKMK